MLTLSLSRLVDFRRVGGVAEYLAEEDPGLGWDVATRPTGSWRLRGSGESGSEPSVAEPEEEPERNRSFSDCWCEEGRGGGRLLGVGRHIFFVYDGC